eukprot:gene12344-40485_t
MGDAAAPPAADGDGTPAHHDEYPDDIRRELSRELAAAVAHGCPKVAAAVKAGDLAPLPDGALSITSA